jgi:fission 1 protein
MLRDGQTCEVEVNEKTKVSGGDSGKNESIMRLSWALVHSRHPSDVQRGIAMLEGTDPHL